MKKTVAVTIGLKRPCGPESPSSKRGKFSDLDPSLISERKQNISANFIQNEGEYLFELRLGAKTYRLRQELWESLGTLKSLFDRHTGSEANTGFTLDSIAQPYYHILEEVLGKGQLIGVQQFQNLLKAYVAKHSGSSKSVSYLFNLYDYLDCEHLDLFKDLALCSGLNMSISSSGISFSLSQGLQLPILDQFIQPLGTIESPLSLKLMINQGGIQVLQRFSHQYLTSLTLSGHLMNDTQLSALAPAFIAFTCLTSLDLGANYIEGSALDPIFRNLITLKHLNLSCNQIKYTTMPLFLTSLCSLSNLETLNFSRNPIGYSSARYLGQALTCFTNLKNLDLSNNDLRNFGMNTLLPSLEGLTNLERLSLSGNELSGQGVDWSMLRGLTGLKDLSIARNLFKPNSLTPLFSSLVTLKTLVRLDLACLSSFGISKEGFNVLVNVLSGLTSLEALILSGNKITYDSAYAMRLLTGLTSLGSVDLQDNIISPQGIELLKTQLSTLTTLKILSNPTQDE